MKPIEVICYKCPVCGVTYLSKGTAEKCCETRKCESCGKVLPDGKKYAYTKCVECREKDEIEKEKQRFSKAIKYTIETAPAQKSECYFSSVFGENEGYFFELEELHDYCDSENIPVPKYCYGTDKYQIDIDVDSVVENACEELYDDAMSSISDEDLNELRTMTAKWCEKQSGTITYEVDYNCAILLNEKEDNQI